MHVGILNTERTQHEVALQTLGTLVMLCFTELDRLGRTEIHNIPVMLNAGQSDCCSFDVCSVYVYDSKEARWTSNFVEEGG